MDIGICSYEELLAAVQLARKRKARAEARAAKETAKREREAAKGKAEATAGVEQAPQTVLEAAPVSAVNPYSAHIPMERPGQTTEAAPAGPGEPDNVGNDEENSGKSSAEEDSIG